MFICIYILCIDVWFFPLFLENLCHNHNFCRVIKDLTAVHAVVTFSRRTRCRHVSLLSGTLLVSFHLSQPPINIKTHSFVFFTFSAILHLLIFFHTKAFSSEYSRPPEFSRSRSCFLISCFLVSLSSSFFLLFTILLSFTLVNACVASVCVEERLMLDFDFEVVLCVCIVLDFCQYLFFWYGENMFDLGFMFIIMGLSYLLIMCSWFIFVCICAYVFLCISQRSSFDLVKFF